MAPVLGTYRLDRSMRHEAFKRGEGCGHAFRAELRRGELQEGPAHAARNIRIRAIWWPAAMNSTRRNNRKLGGISKPELFAAARSQNHAATEGQTRFGIIPDARLNWCAARDGRNIGKQSLQAM
jgi:hypothetical protein